MKTNLEWFRTFKAVFETGTMSEAAKELNISQPGVGLHLNSLEAYIGYPLFERSSRKMIPNERAKLLYQQILNALSRLEDIESGFCRRNETRRSTLTFGMFPTLFRQLFESHIPDLDFNLVMYLENNEKLLSLLENGAVDLAITTDKLPIRNVVYEKLGKTCFVLVGGYKTNLSSFYDLNIEDKEKVSRWLESQLWYTTADRSILNRFWKDNFGKEPDFVPNYIVPDKDSVLRCLSKGEGIAILPDSICREMIEKGSIVYLWKGYVSMENMLYFGYRRNHIVKNEIQQIKDIITVEFEKLCK